MATITTSSASIKIPADYLADVRSALIGEIAIDADALRVNDAGVCDEDRDSAARILQRDMPLLDALLAAIALYAEMERDDDVTLTAEHDSLSDPLVAVLEGMVRQLAKRLRDAAQYAPVPMGEILDLTERIRWAADEAVRITPAVGDRLTVEDRQRSARK
jgi:hypothetical protein